MAKLSVQCCCLLVMMLCSRAALGQPFPSRTVALSGNATPDASGETYASFPSFVPPLMNRLGQVTFEAATNTGERVLVTENGGSPQVVFHTGAQVPGVEPGVTSFFLNGVAVNQPGDILFSVLFEGEPINTTNDGGLFRWRVDGGALELLARKGDPAAGTTDGSLYGFFGNLRIDNDGGAGFSTPLQNTMNDTALYRTNSPPVLIDYDGNMTPDGGTVTEIRSFIKSRQMELWTRAVNTGDAAHDELIAAYYPIVGDPATASLRSGDAAVGYPSGTEFDFIGLTPGANDSAEGAFFATVKGTSTGGGVWAWRPFSDPPEIRLVVKEGQPAPGAPGKKISFVQNIVLNSEFESVTTGSWSETVPGSGSIASGAGGTDGEGIWYENENGELTLAAITGQQAPGTPNGVTIASISWPSFNAQGQLAFHAGLIGPGVDFSNDAAVFITDPNGELHKVVRKGDLFDANDDPAIEDMRTITTVSSPANSGGEDGRGTSLNDAGQLALSLTLSGFTSGVFVFNTMPAGIPGDHNNDGSVNAADYLVWRKTDGSQNGYDTWRANFGRSSNAGATGSASASVPEPSSATLGCLFSLLLLIRRRLAAN